MLGHQRELPFGDPLLLPSVLSGMPSYILRTSEIELALAPRELLRLWRRNLRPDEFFKLRDTYGVFFEIHDDFYFEDTGEALQPVEDEDEDDSPTD
ncbi:hypothetical protein F6X40_34630 [Paraburkholderia sp. UCT31]|uniref:hypothetical protein n=1 Tax=Paraburkholderia sp. UCT31 TaxID=2615209 RepID=UPI001CA45C79|nr:hypothetical protein [Paraburkholderia sp. UCT31]MBC8741700.1 hypothetical protein [Paraburkholderia sp. UCT31]